MIPNPIFHGVRVDLPLLVVYHLTTPVRILVGLSKYVPKRLANFPSDYHDIA